jgi:hypothetical protein
MPLMRRCGTLSASIKTANRRSFELSMQINLFERKGNNKKLLFVKMQTAASAPLARYGKTILHIRN